MPAYAGVTKRIKKKSANLIKILKENEVGSTVAEKINTLPATGIKPWIKNIYALGISGEILHNIGNYSQLTLIAINLG